MSKPKKHTVQIHFDNEKAAEHFFQWLSNSGEQDYWLSQELREEEEPKGDITVVDFDYWNGKKDPKQSDFGKEIIAKCGRLDKGRNAIDE